MPPSSLDVRGLGGAITFAYDEAAICEELLPAFGVDLWGLHFVTCETIYAAMRQSFAAWTSNHPAIKFHDVTSDCRFLADVSGGPFGSGCSLAEIWLTTTNNESAQDAAATTLSQYEYRRDFYRPNGQRAEPGAYATVASVIAFSAKNDICW